MCETVWKADIRNLLALQTTFQSSMHYWTWNMEAITLSAIVSLRLTVNIFSGSIRLSTPVETATRQVKLQPATLSPLKLDAHHWDFTKSEVDTGFSFELHQELQHLRRSLTCYPFNSFPFLITSTWTLMTKDILLKPFFPHPFLYQVV